MQYTSTHGTHHSSNGAFTRPIRGRRRNLVVKTNIRVVKISIDELTQQAIGVEYLTTDNKAVQVWAKKEVIAIRSPKLLMLSGIGPADDLSERKIKVIKDSPVGKTLGNYIRVPGVKFNLSNVSSRMASLKDIQNDIVHWMSSHESPVSANGIYDTVSFHRSPYETHPGIPNLQISPSHSISFDTDNFMYIPRSR